MRRTMVCCVRLVLGLAGVLIPGNALADDPAQEILDKLRQRYESMNDAELRFVQKTTLSMANIDQQVSGTLCMKKEHKYRVELENQTIVTDGKTVWSYSATTNQVLIDSFKMDERSFSPERILIATPQDFEATFLGHEKVGKVETGVLRLVPKTEQSFVKHLKLWVDEHTWLIKKVELVDVNGKETVYLVTEIRVNQDVPDSRFTYQIPADVDVVDLR